MLAGSGVSSLARSVSGIAIGGTVIGPAKAMKAVAPVINKLPRRIEPLGYRPGTQYKFVKSTPINSSDPYGSLHTSVQKNSTNGEKNK